MKQVIYTMSKTNIAGATLLACFLAVVSNMAFNSLAEMLVNESAAQNINTMIDVLQLACYVGVKLYRFKKLNRYDLPFVVGGSLAIVL